ncbi:MAG: dihydroorotate dehydrogenase electron transfer subunit [Candidatus Goldiibacteriota bacterium]
MKHKAETVYNRKTGAGFYHMKIKTAAKFSAKPAQFINIRVSDSYAPLLRRPFSVFDAGENYAEIVYKVIGRATEILSEKKKNDPVDFIGPLGNSYLDFLEPETLKKNIILVGGGTGTASVHYLAEYLRGKNIKFTLIQGARTDEMIIMKEKLEKLGCIFCTEDGSYGIKGLAGRVLEETLKPDSVVFACGPEGMIKAVRKEARREKNTRVLASLEAYMGCGIGACISCVVAVGRKDNFEYKRVCKEGPVFDVKDVLF